MRYVVEWANNGRSVGREGGGGGGVFHTVALGPEAGSGWLDGCVSQPRVTCNGPNSSARMNFAMSGGTEAAHLLYPCGVFSAAPFPLSSHSPNLAGTVGVVSC